MDQIEAAGKTWTAYMEDMPSPCAATDSGLYVAKHNPFVHFTDIVSNGARCSSHVVPLSRFSSDLSSDTLAHFVWMSPNLCNDMHDCSVAAGDAWAASVIPSILQSPAFADSALFLTFDEGTSSLNGGGRIPLVVASPWTGPGVQSATMVDHYSVLRTIQDAWGLAPLARSANATAMTGFFPRPPVMPSEQVIYANDVTTLTGLWNKIADATAAAGVKLTTADNGSGAPPNASANPSSYFDAVFQAAAGTRYRVWLRLHAQNDSKWNDSVFVQFSDSVDAQGAAVYRVGTTSGYIVNLWTCATCQSVGWGWQRNAYWLNDSGDVWFTAGGTHTIRVQVREDGVEIDQVVISPTQYVTSAPGPVSSDTTIVPKPSATPPPPPPPPPPTVPPDIVVYASDVPATAVHGAWVRGTDVTAAASTILTTPDTGVANTTAPLASPIDYADVTFSAPANTAYTLWLRLRAQNNSKFNDSVWVQFSDATAGGAPVYQLNTTSGLLVNLATDATAASLSAWGWQNTAYWLSQATTIVFTTSGAHTLRLQTREDGFALDQIVLSPVTFLAKPPGSVSDDRTIVPKP
jgi:Phosphoesterase family